MRDHRTARLLSLLALAGTAGESILPGGRPGLLQWLGEQLDGHPGDDGHRQVEQLLRQRLANLQKPAEN